MIRLIGFVLLFKAKMTGRLLSRHIILRCLILSAIVFFFVLLSRLILLNGYDYLYAAASILEITRANFRGDKVAFYKQQFTQGAYYLILFSECLLTALPWMVMLLITGRAVYSAGLLFYCLVFPVIVRRGFSFSMRVIPTFYAKSSYEFNYGFRTLFLLYLLLFSLLLIGALVKNDNLFIASAVGVVVFTSLTQNGNFSGEDRWLGLYKCSAAGIIISKIKQGSVNLLWLLSPVLVISMIDFQHLFLPTLAVMAAGVLYYGFSILCRLVFFQNPLINSGMQVMSLLLFTVLPFFPLLLVFVAPIACLFYLRAIKSLNYLLND